MFGCFSNNTEHWKHFKNSLYTIYNLIRHLFNSPCRDSTAESNSMRGTSGLSEILLGMVESPHCWHTAPVFFIRPKFVALHAESHLINGFLVVSEGSWGNRCTMWPSVFILPASWGTFPEINTPWAESPSPSCRLHLFIFFPIKVCKHQFFFLMWANAVLYH